MTKQQENAEDMAKNRTDWAEDRTLMANERTFASWVGMGLGSVGVAIGLKAVFKDFEPTWVAKSVATLFLIVAVSVFWTARNSACNTYKRLEEDSSDTQTDRAYTRVAVGLTIAVVGTAATLWLL